MHTRIQGTFERALVQTHTSKNEIPAHKTVALTKVIVCLWMNNLHVVYFFLVDRGVAGHWTAAPQTVLPKPFSKGCLGYAKSDALKLRCEIKLSQSTGNQFTRWKNTRGRCLRGVLYFYFLGIYCSNIFGKWTTHSKTETLNLHRLED